MARTPERPITDVLDRAAQPIADHATLVDWIADARFVLLGEASHGTHEFYRERAMITRRLIEERGFLAVAAEADWPDAARLNRYVRGVGDDTSAEQALADFVVWAHNSHLGDARATEMGERGELNVGQLARSRYHRDTLLLGFTTHHGAVTAATDWDEPTQQRIVRPALPGSYEAMFHTAELPRFLLAWRPDDRIAHTLRDTRLERAIGVVYRPETERRSHYFLARLADQFDAVLHFDETRAVQPLDRTPEWDTHEAPETYPFSV
jgi:erythromycin esterase-like protein